MAKFRPDQAVGIPCEIHPGAFGGEYLVSIRIDGSEISGFAQEPDLVRTGDRMGYIRSKVVEVDQDKLSVRIPGSFFTTTGVAFLSPDWAKTNLQTDLAA